VKATLKSISCCALMGFALTCLLMSFQPTARELRAEETKSIIGGDITPCLQTSTDHPPPDGDWYCNQIPTFACTTQCDTACDANITENDCNNQANGGPCWQCTDSMMGVTKLQQCQLSSGSGTRKCREMDPAQSTPCNTQKTAKCNWAFVQKCICGTPYKATSDPCPRKNCKQL